VLTTGPSGFLWLRYLCAAIISPKIFGLVDYDVPPEKMRDLTLIVKVLQNLGTFATIKIRSFFHSLLAYSPANLIEFGQKEQFMVVCNPWIISRKQDMIQVIDQLCAFNDKGITPRFLLHSHI
jgi:Ras GTPase-activating protein 1